MLSAHRIALYSQLSLLVSIAACVAIYPSVAFSKNQGGVSNYGTSPRTLAVFSIGAWICIFFLIWASKKISHQKLKRVVLALAIAYGLLVISTYPYKINNTFENIHIAVAFGLVLFQLGVGLWFTFLNHFDKNTRIGFGLQLLSLCLGFLIVFQVVNLLFTAQLIGALGFGYLLIHTVRLHR